MAEAVDLLPLPALVDWFWFRLLFFVFFFFLLRGATRVDGVAVALRLAVARPRLSRGCAHAPCGLSRGRVDGVEAAWSHEDAIAAT